MDQSTPTKVVQKVARQRIEAGDHEETCRQSMLNTENHTFELLCDFPCCVRGFHVGEPTGVNAPVTKGAAVVDGQLLKLGADSLVALAPNLDVAPRTDTVVINGSLEQNSDLHNPRALSALTIEPAVELVIGVADGSKKRFELLHDKVDLSTLVIKLGGVQVAGWVFSKGTGTTLPNVDEVLFETAPVSGVLTASYKWMNGGIERTASNQPGRKTITPNLYVRQGVTVSGINAKDIPLAEVTLPAGWVGGSVGVTVDNSVKQFLVAPDSENIVGLPDSLRLSAGPGGLASAMRGIDQVKEGLRLVYSDTNKVKITPGWGVIAGRAFFLNETTEFTITAGSAGWKYIYIRPSHIDVNPLATHFEVSTVPPTNKGRDDSASFYNAYIGAVFVESVGPVVIRPFFTHRDWTYWASVSEIDLPVGANDITVTDWLPETGKLICARLNLEYTGASPGDALNVAVRSHRSASGLNWPQFDAEVAPPSNTSAFAYSQGIVRAESFGGMFIHSIRSEGISGTKVAKLRVLGYQDDYRTMDGAGLPTFY